MIFFVTTYSHRRTHKVVSNSLKPFRRVSYPYLFSRRSLPRATYIFTDFDRLNFLQLELAANLYWQLSQAGCRVLNNPTKALLRLELLENLYKNGLNSFKAWRGEDFGQVDRFPVFLRTRAAHRGVLTELIDDKASLQLKLHEMQRLGHPVSNLMIVEYRSSTVEAGIFRKLAIYKIGDELIPVPSAHEDNWVVKFGQQGVASAEAYASDLDQVKTAPYKDQASEVFRLANADYGRLDFAQVNGRLEFYEINTNPMIKYIDHHPFQDRLTAFAITEQRYNKAMLDLDTDQSHRKIKIEPPASVSLRPGNWRNLLPGYLWLP